MADALDALRKRLETDANARATFAADLKTLLENQGVNLRDAQQLSELGMRDFQVRPSEADLKNMASSTVVVTIVF